MIKKKKTMVLSYNNMFVQKFRVKVFVLNFGSYYKRTDWISA